MVNLGGAPHQVTRVIGITEPLRAADNLGNGEVAKFKCNLLEAHDLEALARFDGAHEGRSVVQTLMGAGIEPGEAATQPHDVEIAAFEISAIDVADLKFAARRRRQGRGN